MHCSTIMHGYLHHPEEPILALPAEVAKTITKESLEQMPRNELMEDTLKEFRKTAKVVGSSPWFLLKAQAYLEKLCADNEGKTIHQGPVLDTMFNYKLTDVAPINSADTEVDNAALPRRVCVARAKGKAEGKGKAKAKAKGKAKAKAKKGKAKAKASGTVLS